MTNTIKSNNNSNFNIFNTNTSIFDSSLSNNFKINIKQKEDDVVFVNDNNSIYQNLSTDELKQQLTELEKKSSFNSLKGLDNSQVEADIKLIRRLYEDRGNQIISIKSLDEKISDIDAKIQTYVDNNDKIRAEDLKNKKKSYEFLKSIINKTNKTYFNYEELISDISTNILTVCYKNNDLIFDEDLFKEMYKGYEIEDFYNLLIDNPSATDDPLLLFKAQKYVYGNNVEIINNEFNEKKKYLQSEYLSMDSISIDSSKSNFMMLALLSKVDSSYDDMSLQELNDVSYTLNDDYKMYLNQYQQYIPFLSDEEISNIFELSKKDVQSVNDYIFTELNITERVAKGTDVFYDNESRIKSIQDLVANVYVEKYNYVFPEDDYKINYQNYSIAKQTEFQVESNYNFQMLQNEDFSTYLKTEDIQNILNKEHKKVENIDKYAENYDKIAYYLTDDEKKVYYYRLNKYGEDNAKKYLLFLKSAVRMRAGQEEAQKRLEIFKIGEDEQGNPVYDFSKYYTVGSTAILTAMGFDDGVDNFFVGLKNCFYADKEQTCFDYEKMFIMETLNRDGKIGQELAYEFGSSLGNMAPVIITSMALQAVPFVGQTAVPSLVSTLGMGASSFGNNKHELYVQGYDGYKMYMRAALGAMSEVALEKFLGTIPGISVVNKTSEASAIGADKNLVKFLKYILLNSAKEGIEESSQVIVDSLMDSIFFGNEFSIDFEELVKSGLLGALSGGITNATTIGISKLPININGMKYSLETTLIDKFGITNDRLLDLHYKTALAEVLTLCDEKTRTPESIEKAADVMDKAGFNDVADNIRTIEVKSKDKNTDSISQKLNESNDFVKEGENVEVLQIDSDVIDKTKKIKTKYADDNILIDGMSCHMIMPELLIETLNKKGLGNVFTNQNGVYTLNEVDAKTKYEVLNTIANYVTNEVGQIVLDNETTLDAWSTGVGKDVTSKGNMAESMFKQGKVEQANTMLINLINKVNDFRQGLVETDMEQVKGMKINQSTDEKQAFNNFKFNAKSDLNVVSFVVNTLKNSINKGNINVRKLLNFLSGQNIKFSSESSISKWDSSTNTLYITKDIINNNNFYVVFHEISHMIFDRILGNTQYNAFTGTKLWDRIISDAQAYASNYSDGALQRNGKMLNDLYKYATERAKSKLPSEDEFISNKIKDYRSGNLSKILFENNINKENIGNVSDSILEYFAHIEYESAVSNVRSSFTEYQNIQSISDITDAIFKGSHTDLNGNAFGLYGLHGVDYYSINGASPHEIVANFFQIKLTGTDADLNLIKNTFGSNFYNTLNTLYDYVMEQCNLIQVSHSENLSTDGEIEIPKLDDNFEKNNKQLEMKSVDDMDDTAKKFNLNERIDSSVSNFIKESITDDGYFGVFQDSTSRYKVVTIKDVNWLSKNSTDLELYLKTKYNLKNADTYIEKWKKTRIINDFTKEVLEKYIYECNPNNFDDNISLINNLFGVKELPEYIRQKNILMKKGLSEKDSIKILDSMNNEEFGIANCTYASTANAIFSQFDGKENEFKKIFGFDMYVEIDGVKRLNGNELILDMYIFMNSNLNKNKYYPGKLLNIGSDGNIVLNDINVARVRANSNSILSEYFNSKGLKHELDQICLGFSGIKIDKNNIEKELHINLSGDKSYKLDLRCEKNNDFGENTVPIKFYDLSGNLLLNMDNSGHSVFITGISNKGVECSSWGKKCYIPFSCFTNNNRVTVFSVKLEV